MWPTQTLCRNERMSESLKWNNAQSSFWRALWLRWPKKVALRSVGQVPWSNSLGYNGALLIYITSKSGPIVKSWKK